MSSDDELSYRKYRDKTALALMDTPCEFDYKKRHYWERIGTVLCTNGTYLIWRCTQCNLCVEEHLSFIPKDSGKQDIGSYTTARNIISKPAQKNKEVKEK